MKKILIAGVLVTMIFVLLAGCMSDRVSAGATEISSDEVSSDELSSEDLNSNALSSTEASVDGQLYYFPHEGEVHEGTWLQWPHNNTYEGVIEVYEPIWIEMTRALSQGENVHLIVYDDNEKERVRGVLEDENIPLENIDFFVFKTDDVWIRDNGPIFAFDQNDELVIQNWEFNGWGNKAPFEKDNLIPSQIAGAIDVPLVNIDMVMEGGALELDGKGTLISTLSCVNNDNRTADFTLEEIEAYLAKYYGVTNFIWLDGVAGMDITDNHIDGMVKFVDEHTIVADQEFDLDPTEVEDYKDAKTLLSAKNAYGEPYDFVFLPSTRKPVFRLEGEEVHGSYLNFYVGNGVVLVPNYNDKNDAKANAIIQTLYPERDVIGIDVRDLFRDGGMIHCVTQQQPLRRGVSND